MEEEAVLVEELKQILEKAREEYLNLSNLDLLRTNKEKLRTYFRHAGLLKELISSNEAYLNEYEMSRQLNKSDES